MKRQDIKYLNNYFDDFKNLLDFKHRETKKKIIDLKKILFKTKKRGKKVLIFGNGGSASIANHFSVDITKNTKIQCVNFNESGLITCFSNDFGFDHWIEKTIEYYGNAGDVLIVISSSGRSKNMIYACKAAKKKKFFKIITLTGHSKNNPLRKLGNINLWVDCKVYNYIENIHQFWLLSLVDLIVGRRNYLSR